MSTYVSVVKRYSETMDALFSRLQCITLGYSSVRELERKSEFRRKRNSSIFLIVNGDFFMDFINGWWWVSSHSVIYIPMGMFERVI